MGEAIVYIWDDYFLRLITRKTTHTMPMLNAVSNELYVGRAFIGMQGSGYELAGSGSGIPKRKVKKAVKSTGKFLKKNKGKIARSALNLASAFGSEDTKQKADNIRLAHEIVKGSGVVPPGAALRKLVS